MFFVSVDCAIFWNSFVKVIQFLASILEKHTWHWFLILFCQDLLKKKKYRFFRRMKKNDLALLPFFQGLISFCSFKSIFHIYLYNKVVLSLCQMCIKSLTSVLWFFFIFNFSYQISYLFIHASAPFCQFFHDFRSRFKTRRRGISGNRCCTWATQHTEVRSSAHGVWGGGHLGFWWVIWPGICVRLFRPADGQWLHSTRPKSQRGLADVLQRLFGQVSLSHI